MCELTRHTNMFHYDSWRQRPFAQIRTFSSASLHWHCWLPLHAHRSHAPPLRQSRAYHALITRRPSHHWSRSHTHLFFIGGVLPPASLLCILFSFLSLSGACFTQLLVKPNWIPVRVASLNGRSSSVSLFCSTFHLVISHTFWADVNTSVF